VGGECIFGRRKADGGKRNSPVTGPQSLPHSSLAKPAPSAAEVASPPLDRMLYMIIENFRDGDARPVYRRFRDRGRLAPDGLRYVSSWVTSDLRRCYQVMECDDIGLVEEWMRQWRDIVDFECIPVMTSAEAASAVAPNL
jgi:hypothetical protein